MQTLTVGSNENAVTIEYEIFEAPVSRSLKEVVEDYSTGAFLICTQNADEDKVEIVGYCKYTDQMYPEYLEKALVENELLEANEDYRYLLIKPTPRTAHMGTTYYSLEERSYQYDKAQEIERFLNEEKKRRERKHGVVEEINQWLEKKPFAEFEEYLKKRVKGQEDITIIAAEIYHYLVCAAKGVKIRTNLLMAAPSGCGKTETYRALKDYFADEIPNLIVYQKDVSRITESGYKGEEPLKIIEPLLMKPRANGIGIIMMDELDKKIMPSYTGKDTNINATVQGQILTMIEGYEFKNVRVNQNYVCPSCDTGNTMFIGMGAFDACRKKKSVIETHIGFNCVNDEGKDHYTNITKDDMIELGASYEFLGRFATVVNFHKLGTEVVDEIIEDMLNRLSIGFQCNIEISDELRCELHNHTNSQYGCRGIESRLHESVMQGYVAMLKEGDPNVEYKILADVGHSTFKEEEGDVEWESS